MSTIKDQEHLMEVLKFTPRTYKIRLWGYGGEYVMGEVDRKAYDYFRARRLALDEFAWDSDYADDNNIPEDMQPFYPGQWHDCDGMGHCWGVDRSAGTLQVEDENGNVVYEKSLDDISGMGVYEENPELSEPEWSCGEEIWIDMKPAGTAVFVGVSSEKGTFFEGNIELKTPFNPGKIALCYDEIDGNEIITSVTYNEEVIDNWGGDTSGKSTDFGMYIAGSNKQDGKGYEKYRNMDDIEYTLTDWFPAKTKPAREGKYEIKTKDGYTYHAMWNGEYWKNDWSDEKLKVKEWRGIAYDPDEQDLRDELDRIALEVPGFPTATQIDELEQVECVQCDWKGAVEQTNDWDGQMCCPECGEPVEFIDSEDETVTQNTGWPFGPAEITPYPGSDAPVEKKELTAWTVSTYYKKSIEEVEYFTKDGMTIVHRTGWRSGSWTVYTNDGNPPEFKFTTVPGGNDNIDSIDMNSCYYNNIEEVEFVETFDGCWDDTEWPDDIDEDEKTAMEEAMDENGYYDAFESNDWYHSETEMWIWGPILIEGDNDYRRIIEADDNGNVVDFKDE